MSSQPDLVQSCVESAAREARLALEHCIDYAVAGLQVAETQTFKAAERDRMATAWRELQKHKAAWLDQYSIGLLEAFNAGISTTARAALMRDGLFLATPPERTPGAAPNGPLALESLSLVDDADVAQAIESSRLLQQILPAVEQPLAELDKLISSAQGLGSVRPELNPLRPEVFATTLRELIFATPAESAISSLWIRHLAPPLGRELKRVYELAVNQLELANVQQAGYRLVQAPAGGRAAGGSGTSSGVGDSEGHAGRGGSGGSGGMAGSGGSARNGSGAPGGLAGGARAGQPSGTEAGRSPFGYISDEPLVPKLVQYADLSRDSVTGELFQQFLAGNGGDSPGRSGRAGGGSSGDDSRDDHRLAPAYYDNIEEELRALKAAPDSALSPLDDAEASSGSAADESLSVPSGYRELPAVDRPQRLVNQGSQLSEKIWGVFARRKERTMVRTELKKKAQRLGQVMGLELVRQLVNEVAQDPRLLSPVREGIVALEPSLLRLAMVDPRFLKEETHPGRRLMERVAQRSFKYNDEFADEFLAFFEPVHHAFNALNKLTIDSKEPFGLALAELESGWNAQDEAEASQRNAVLQAMRFAEQRQLEADRIAFDLSDRTDLDEVPALVLDFLFSSWALAMAHARLTDTRNQIDPQGLGMVVPDLVWSAKRSMTLKQPAKLIEMIPGLLARLQAGLELLGKDARESEAFFDGLMRLHQPVLKLRRLKSQRDAEESASAPLEPEAMPATPEQRRAKAAARPWMGRKDLEAAGFEDLGASEHGALSEAELPVRLPETDSSLLPLPAHAQPGEPLAKTVSNSPAPDAVVKGEGAALDTGPGDGTGSVKSGGGGGSRDGEGSEANDPPDAGETLRGLRTGAWVDLHSKDRWLRAQLVWASSRATLFMFVSHGGRAHSMTRRSCERLIAERLLRPVNSDGVVSLALDAVMLQAAPPAATDAPSSAHSAAEAESFQS